MSLFITETCTKLAGLAESLQLLGRQSLRRGSLIKSVDSSTMIDQPDRLEEELIR